MELSDVPVGEQNLLADLENQFMQLAGFPPIDFPPNVLVDMYQHGIDDLFSFGQYVQHSTISSDSTHGPGYLGSGSPWAYYGLTRQQWASHQQSLDSEYFRLTGQHMSDDQFRDELVKSSGTPSASALGAQWATDKNLQSTYGWLKYGMDYTRFQQERQLYASIMGVSDDALTNQTMLEAIQARQVTGMDYMALKTYRDSLRGDLGHEATLAETVTQYEHRQRFQGSDMAVRMKSGGQQSQGGGAGASASGSVVR